MCRKKRRFLLKSFPRLNQSFALDILFIFSLFAHFYSYLFTSHFESLFFIESLRINLSSPATGLKKRSSLIKPVISSYWLFSRSLPLIPNINRKRMESQWPRSSSRRHSMNAILIRCAFGRCTLMSFRFFLQRNQ